MAILKNKLGNTYDTETKVKGTFDVVSDPRFAPKNVPPIKPGAVDAPQIGNVQAYKLAPAVTPTYGGLESATTALVETAKTQAETNVEEKKNHDAAQHSHDAAQLNETHSVVKSVLMRCSSSFARKIDFNAA